MCPRQGLVARLGTMPKRVKSVWGSGDGPASVNGDGALLASPPTLCLAMRDPQGGYSWQAPPTSTPGPEEPAVRLWDAPGENG